MDNLVAMLGFGRPKETPAERFQREFRERDERIRERYARLEDEDVIGEIGQ